MGLKEQETQDEPLYYVTHRKTGKFLQEKYEEETQELIWTTDPNEATLWNNDDLYGFLTEHPTMSLEQRRNWWLNKLPNLKSSPVNTHLEGLNRYFRIRKIPQTLTLEVPGFLVHLSKGPVGFSSRGRLWYGTGAQFWSFCFGMLSLSFSRGRLRIDYEAPYAESGKMVKEIS